MGFKSFNASLHIIRTQEKLREEEKVKVDFKKCYFCDRNDYRRLFIFLNFFVFGGGSVA